jgi:hypothetical protein
MDEKAPLSLVAEIECTDRVDAELVRLELERLARRHGTKVQPLRPERRLD